MSRIKVVVFGQSVKIPNLSGKGETTVSSINMEHERNKDLRMDYIPGEKLFTIGHKDRDDEICISTDNVKWWKRLKKAKNELKESKGVEEDNEIETAASNGPVEDDSSDAPKQKSPNVSRSKKSKKKVQSRKKAS